MKRYILALLVLSLIPVLATAQTHPAETYGWGFMNYGSASFNWDTYRRGFIGIPVDSNSSWYTATFDKLYYELLVKTKLADPNGDGNGDGTCFGMQALSLMCNKYGGYLGFCAPTTWHGGDTSYGGAMGPYDPRLRKACDIMHVHQVSLPMIELYLDQVLQGHSQNANIGIQLARQTLGKEGAFLVSITQTTNISNGGGHVVIGYNVTGAAGKDTIWVVDPNRIWVNLGDGQRNYYTGKKNGIFCAGSVWRFLMAGKLSDWPTNNDTTAGSPLGSGHLIIIPISVAGPTARTPTSLGLSIAQLLAKIFLFSNDGGQDAQVLQVTRADGKQLFVPGTRTPDWNAKTGMCTMAPWAPLGTGDGGNDKHRFEAYFNKGGLPEAAIEVATGTKGSTLAAGHNESFVKVAFRTPDAKARVTYSGLDGEFPTVRIDRASKPIVADVTVTLASLGGDTTMSTFTLKNVTIPANDGRGVMLKVQRNREVYISGGSAAPTVFEYAQRSTNATKECTKRVPVVPTQGQVLTLRELLSTPPVTGE